MAQWWRIRLPMQETWVFDPWVRKIPWRKKWQPIPVFLPGKPHGQRSLVGYSIGGRKRVGHGWLTKQQWKVKNKEQHLHLPQPRQLKPGESQTSQQVHSTDKRKSQELGVRGLQVHSPYGRLDWFQDDTVFRSQRSTGIELLRVGCLPSGWWIIFSFFFFKLQFILSTPGRDHFRQRWHLTRCSVGLSVASLSVTGRKQETKCCGTLWWKLRQTPPLYPGQCRLSLQDRLSDLNGCLNTTDGRSVAWYTPVN